MKIFSLRRFQKVRIVPKPVLEECRQEVQAKLDVRRGNLESLEKDRRIFEKLVRLKKRERHQPILTRFQLIFFIKVRFFHRTHSIK
jgi:hypothetical protein